MNDRQRISRNKGTTSNQSIPSFKPKVRGWNPPSYYSTSESHEAISKKSEISQESETTAREQDNQENIKKESSQESAFADNNHFHKVSFRPYDRGEPANNTIGIRQQSIQRQELEKEKEDNQATSELVQAKETTDKQRKSVELPFEDTKHFHKVSFRPYHRGEPATNDAIEIRNQIIQRQELEEDKEENQVHSEIVQRQELEEEKEQQELDGVIQAKCSECEREEQEEKEQVQTKLTVGKPGDKYEQEADAVAAKVVEQINSPSSEQTVQGKVEPVVTQVMRQGGVGGGTVNQNVEQNIQQARGSGQGLADNVREPMEQAFGTDFSGVKVHTDGQSDVLNRSLNARAFTTGQDIFFKQGEYQPGSKQGQELLAHELTHVVQQGEGSKLQSKSNPTSKNYQFPIKGLDSKILQPSPLLQPPLALTSTSYLLQRYSFSEFGDDVSDFGGDLLEAGVDTVADVTGIDIRDYVDDIPGYRLFTVIIEYDPIRRTGVERNAINLVEGLLGLLGPIGGYIFDALQEHQILERAFDWIEEQLNDLNLSQERLERTIDAFIEDVGITDVLDVVEIAERHFGPLLNDIESFARSLINQLIEMIKEVAVGLAEDLLDEDPAWDLIKKVIHYDPLRDEEVNATTVEILEDFLMLIGKQEELEQMQENGTLQETADWLDTQIGVFLGLLGQFRNLITAAWDAIQPENLPNLVSNVDNLTNQIFGLLQGVGSFALTIALKVVELIKNALLDALSSYADRIPGYHLLTVMLEQDPFTQEEVPLTPTNLIRGFMSLIPGGEEQFQQLQETGVIPEAAQRIETMMEELGITWAFVQQLFLDIWNSFTIDDLINPIDAFVRVMNEFEEPLNRLFTFAIEVIKVVLELILAMMNFPTNLIGSIITNAMQALDDIQRDPVGFLINLLETAKLGFENFFDNILEHLIGGLTDWLFSTVREAGIEPPENLTFESILGFILDVLGLSMDHMWELLTNHLGQETVDQIRGAIDQLTGAWNFIQDVQERGITAIWEYIESQLSNLWDVVLEQVQEYVMERVINVGMRWLLSLLDATGITPVINSFVAFFNAIESAIEYLNEMLAVVNDFVSTVASIAAGNIEPGAERMEEGLSNSIPIVIGFIANQFGLGDIGERLGEMIAGVREMVDEALNWLIEQALNLGRTALRSLGIGGEAEEETEDIDPTDHNAMATRAANELEEIENPSENYESLRSQKEQQAGQIEERYTRLLEPGIRLSVVFQNRTSDEADNDIDFEIVIAPNTTSVTGSITTSPPVPRMVFRPGFSNSRATSPVEVKYLHNSPGNHDPGAQPTPSRNREAFSILQALNLSQNWVRFHILNHNIGGKNSESNLIPMTRTINLNEYEPDFERPMKEKFDLGKILWMTATFTYHSDGIFIQSYTAEGGEMMFDTTRGQWVENPAEPVPTFSKDNIDYPRAEDIPINELYRFGFDFEIERGLQETNVGITFMRELFESASDKGILQFNGKDDLFSLAEDIIIAREYSENYANRLRGWINNTLFVF